MPETTWRQRLIYLTKNLDKDAALEAQCAARCWTSCAVGEVWGLAEGEEPPTRNRTLWLGTEFENATDAEDWSRALKLLVDIENDFANFTHDG